MFIKLQIIICASNLKKAVELTIQTHSVFNIKTESNAPPKLDNYTENPKIVEINKSKQ
jgi:hypothetical protein